MGRAVRCGRREDCRTLTEAGVLKFKKVAEKGMQRMNGQLIGIILGVGGGVFAIVF